MIFSFIWPCASFSLLRQKKWIIYSLNFLQSCHCFWISAANVISGTVHCLKKITIQEKSLSKGKRGTGEFKHNLFNRLLYFYSVYAPEHTLQPTRTQAYHSWNSGWRWILFEITQQVIYYRGELWLLEQREPQKKTKKKQSSRICLSALVRAFMCYTLTLVDQVESSRAGLAIGGKADQDLVGGG